MSICQVMVSDFMAGTGRYDVDGSELYSERDLIFAADCMDDYMREGLLFEPFHGYHLPTFVVWAIEQLSPSRSGSQE